MSTTDIAAWIGASAAVLGVLAALTSLVLQLRKQTLLNSANQVAALAEQWGSDLWRRNRIHSAQSLRDHIEAAAAVSLSKDLPVFGFFENAGHLVRRGILDEEMFWNKFGWYVVRYYLAATCGTDLIEAVRRREDDQTLWEEFEWLNDRMLKIYRRRQVHILYESQLLRQENYRLRLEELFEQELNLEIPG